MTTTSGLRIALLGTRGIPANYGGFETFAEELSTRLVERGHQVTVYGRRAFGARPTELEPYRGVARIATPTIHHKYLETPLHALTSFLDLLFRRFDVALLCNAANSPFAWLVRLRGVPLLINVDGIERERGKWNALGRLWYRLGELSSVLFASRVIADADVIADYYRERFHRDATVIGYGAEPKVIPPGAVLKRFGLAPGRYLLYVSRLEPENNALGVIRAYRQVATELPLVVVGDAPYAKAYIDSLKEAADERVIFTGYQFGDAYWELRSHCALYVQATEVGGTHPALVEAMASGNAIIANRVPEHEEVLADTGTYYPKNDFDSLANEMRRLLADPGEARRLGEAARERARALFSWDAVTERYERLLTEVAGRGGLPANQPK